MITAPAVSAPGSRLAASRGAEGVAVGLVPSKTTLQSCISFAAPIVAERRIKRLKKSVWASGHLHGMAENGYRPSKPWFVTLTYAGQDEWRPEHVSKAVQGFRNWCRSIGVPCRYTWVAELTPTRGRVHYHLLAWLPIGVRMPHWDRKVGKRAAWWPHGMTQTELARSGVGYLMKYLSKLGELTKFPKGLRLYGIGGLTQQGRQVRSWLNLPEWVKLSHGVGEVCKTVSGFVVRSTGEILEPAYQVFRVPSGLILRALRQLPERFHSGAYSAYPRVNHGI